MVTRTKWFRAGLALLMALCLLSGSLAVLAEEPKKASVPLPEIGEVVHGFELKEVRDFPLIDAQVALFEHQRTGAKLTYIANEDTNRAFQLTFLTRPIDNTGLPHVFEHATLSGSEKYPSASLFMNLAYQTYNTYMNAYTTDAMTSYPIASLSEAQLLKYADYYTDSCLHPSILTDESIYRTEAWRYRLPSLEADLTLEGTVYSEMQGAFTLARYAMLQANRVTFPGASIGYEFGGDPDAIPDMTWEDLKAYHDLFYHPSNAMAYLYGGFEDYTAFLALLDEAFAPYEKADFHFEETEYARIAEGGTYAFQYPVAEGSDPANQSVIIYYFVCPGLREDPSQELVVDQLDQLLSESSSPLMQALDRALPSGSFSIGREVAAPDDAIVFYAANLNPEDAAVFQEIVDSALAEIAETGFAQEMMDSAVASLNLSTKLVGESGDAINSIIASLSYNYATTGDPFAYLDSVAALDNLDAWNQDGSYQAAIQTWLLENDLRTLSVTSPDVGGKERHDAALAEQLAQVKASLSEEDLAAIVEASNAEQANDDASALVAQLQAVTVESLPEEIQLYEVSDETGADGIRRIDALAGVDGIGEPMLYLDARSIPQEDLHYFRLFTRLLGQLDTDAHTKEELDVLISRYLYDKTIGISMTGKGEDWRPWLYLSWIAVEEDLATGYDLMNEILYHTQFADAAKVLEKLQAEKASVRASINGSPYSVSLYRSLGADVPRYRYYSYINLLEYYAFLEATEQAMTEAPEEVMARLTAVQTRMQNSHGAISAFAGDAETMALNRQLADAFLAALPNEAFEPETYDLPVPAKREAIIADTNVQFNGIAASLAALGLEEFDAGLNAVATLVTDTYLIPVLRDQYGVYTPWHGLLSDQGLYLITYRDPNVKETFDFYATLPELVSALELDQETLDGYIMNAYSDLAKGTGELTGAVAAVDNLLSGIAQEEKLEWMRQLKAVTPETVQASAELYQKLLENGYYSTAGSAAAVNANAELYDAIYNPFGAKDTSQVELTDVVEGSDSYEAIRFVYENGIMSARSEEAFGIEENATVGDLAAAFYLAIGGPAGAPEEAVPALAGFGLLPGDWTVDTELTGAMYQQFITTFSALAGAELDSTLPADAADRPLTRGELATALYPLFAE